MILKLLKMPLNEVFNSLIPAIFKYAEAFEEKPCNPAVSFLCFKRFELLLLHERCKPFPE